MGVFVVTGRIGKDAVLRDANGTKVANFDVADEIGYGDRKETQWIRCALFGQRGEKLAPHLKKGTLVQVSGSAKVETWNGQNGSGAGIKLTVQEITMHGGGQREGQQPQQSAQQREQPAAPAPKRQPVDDDIPF